MGKKKQDGKKVERNSKRPQVVKQPIGGRSHKTRLVLEYLRVCNMHSPTRVHLNTHAHARLSATECDHRG